MSDNEIINRYRNFIQQSSIDKGICSAIENGTLTGCHIIEKLPDNGGGFSVYCPPGHRGGIPRVYGNGTAVIGNLNITGQP